MWSGCFGVQGSGYRQPPNNMSDWQEVENAERYVKRKGISRVLLLGVASPTAHIWTYENDPDLSQ